MRGDGLSFAAVAGRLGLRRSRDAFDAFHRALNSSGVTDKPRLISEELARLDLLETRIRSRDADAPDKMHHRLEALEHMRQRLSGS